MAVQDRPWAARPEEEAESPSWFTPKRIRLILLASALAVVGTIVFLLFRGAKEEAIAERWDKFAAIRAEFEQDSGGMIDWRDREASQTASRARYIRSLEKFLEEEAKGGDDALEPHVRWLISRLARDQVLAMQNVLDLDRRTALYEKALGHLEVIEKQFPDHPLNWDAFKPQGHVNVARKDRSWVQANLEWEKANLPRDIDPDSEETVVFRTTRGDVRVRLYSSAAPRVTAAFLTKARNGGFDGTMIYERRKSGLDNDPLESSLRGGSAKSRGAKAYDAKGHLDFVRGDGSGGMLPDETRNTVPFTRGILAAWHEGGVPYDKVDEFLFVVARSPSLDYRYTPIGEVVDEAGLAVLDAIFDQPTWNDDPEIRADTSTRGVLDFVQAPATIVKVLVYGKDGSVLEPEGAASKVRVAPTADEGSLSGLKVDAYKTDVPARAGSSSAEAEGSTDGDGEPSDAEGGAAEGSGESDG